jgi:RND family efflux transporter MFP subunit
MNKKYLSVLLIISIVFVLSSCSKPDDTNNEEQTEEKVTVTVGEIKGEDIPLTTYAIGQLSPKATYNAVALSPGEVIKSNFEVGDQVKKDDVLFILDKEDFNTTRNNQLNQLQISLDQAKINLEDAKKAYEDNLILYNLNSIAKSQLDRSKSQYDQAKLQYDNVLSQINSTKDNLSNQEDGLVIQSPVDGIIANKTIEDGMYATNQNGYTIIKNNPIIFKAGVIEEYISKIKVGQKTEVMINALDAKVDGVIKSIGLMKESTTYPVEIELENNDLAIKPGMFAEVNIEYDLLKNQVVIPKEAVITEKGQTYIFLVNEAMDDGFSVTKEYVNVLGNYDSKVYVQEDLLGERVVLKGSTFIDQESIIKISE